MRRLLLTEFRSLESGACGARDRSSAWTRLRPKTLTVTLGRYQSAYALSLTREAGGDVGIGVGRLDHTVGGSLARMFVRSGRLAYSVPSRQVGR